MAFKIGGLVFAHGDMKVTGTPLDGPKAHQQFTFQSAKSVDFDNALKAILLKGTAHEPVAIVAGDADPEFKIGLDVWQETSDYASFCGAGYNVHRHGFLVTLERPGLKTSTVEVVQGIIEKGFGLKSEAGGAPNQEFSGKCRKVKINGLEPFEVRKAGGLSAVLGFGLGISIGFG